jgi:hypothetical protein
MKKLALVAFLAVASAVVLFVPEARAQVRRGTEVVLGSVDTRIGLYGVPKCGYFGACGTATLASGTPSTVAVTVPSGVSCFCNPVGATAAIAAGGCAASVSGTTLTLTGPNTVTTVMRYECRF